jgi:mono/diheme cytochrome c family protein
MMTSTRNLTCATLIALALCACEQQKKDDAPSGGVPAASQPAAQPAQPAQPAKTSTSAAAPQTTPAAPPGMPSVDEGKKLYFTACANCHGPDGTGQMMRQMLPKIGDLTSAEMHARMKDEDIHNLIVTGRDKMPPFGSVFKPEQIKSIIAFVRTMKKS